MTSPHRKRRGAETQAAVSGYLQTHGWRWATDAGAGRAGCDVINTPGICLEVKARRDLNLTGWLKQAAGRPGLPIVIHRPDGMGPASIEDWPATLRLADLVRLLRAAGYGDPEKEGDGQTGHPQNAARL